MQKSYLLESHASIFGCAIVKVLGCAVHLAPRATLFVVYFGTALGLIKYNGKRCRYFQTKLGFIWQEHLLNFA
jgi:hypothetical protein